MSVKPQSESLVKSAWKELPGKRERKGSTTTRLLPVYPGKSEVTRHVICELDFDMSLRRYSNSTGSTSAFSDHTVKISPRPSIIEGRRAGKRVAFYFEPPITPIDQISPSLEDLFQSAPAYTKEEVMMSLMRKDSLDLTPNEVFLSRSESLVRSQQHFELLESASAPDVPREDKLPEQQVEGAEVYLRGDLYCTGLPILSFRLPQGSRGQVQPSSRRVSVGDHSSYLDDDLWPWPWLNPNVRAKQLYIQTSAGSGTFSKQADLPLLPLPSLEHTLDMYLSSVKPCVRPNQFQIIKKIAQEFSQGEGKLYQEVIMGMNDPERKGWIRRFVPNCYHRFSRQEAVLLNTAIVAPFQEDLWPEKPGTQIQRAAILVSLATEFCQLIRNERLVPIMDREGQALCMHSFRKLFSTTKLPGAPTDAVVSYFLRDLDIADRPRHILVMYKGRIYSMAVMDTSWAPLKHEALKEYLQEVVDKVDAAQTDECTGIGALTALDRNMWSRLRCELMDYSANNSACLQDIEQALFVLSLDHTSMSSPNRLVHEAIFADGCNRWYDKSLSFYVHSNGLVTVNVNTAILDGSIVAFLLHFMHVRIMESAEKWDDEVMISVSRSMSAAGLSLGYEDLLSQFRSRMSLMSETTIIDQRHLTSSTTSLPDKTDILRALELDMDDYLEIDLENAKESFCDLASQFSTATCKYEDYERGFFEEKKINRDAFAHLVMQFTFYRMYFRVASVGSKVSLFRFHHQRYEYMRATTEESVAWCRLMLDPDATLEQKCLAFWAAEKKHKQLLKQNSSGQGCENHLAALHVIAEDMYNITPRLFQEHSLCMTSSGSRFEIYAECLGVGCPSCPAVLPSNRRGYGVGYCVLDTKVIFNVCCLASEEGLSAELFTINLSQTMKSLHHFLRLLWR